jgi:hypothetical protein
MRGLSPLPVEKAPRRPAPPRPFVGRPLPEPGRSTPLRPAAPAVAGPMPEPKPLEELPPAALDLPPAPRNQVPFPAPAAATPDLPPIDAQPEDPSTPEPTDADLLDALFPLVETAVGKSLYASQGGLHSYLEPMLRTTVRRAIAELDGPDQPFGAAGIFDRMIWRLQALCTSRTYDEIVFRKTARHRIEEVLLLGRDALDLISYASTDPGCHASPRRVAPLLREVLPRIRDNDGALHLSFEISDERHGVVREGRFTYLVAIVHGALDEFAQADLDFIQRRVEERFGERLQDPSEPLLERIQPMLEDCLLIRSPASAL